MFRDETVDSIFELQKKNRNFLSKNDKSLYLEEVNVLKYFYIQHKLLILSHDILEIES